MIEHRRYSCGVQNRFARLKSDRIPPMLQRWRIHPRTDHLGNGTFCDHRPQYGQHPVRYVAVAMQSSELGPIGSNHDHSLLPAPVSAVTAKPRNVNRRMFARTIAIDPDQEWCQRLPLQSLVTRARRDVRGPFPADRPKDGCHNVRPLFDFTANDGRLVA